MMTNSRNIFGPLGVSLIAIAVLMMTLFVQSPPIFAALGRPVVSESEAQAGVDTAREDHAEKQSLFTDRFTGRSPFFIPPAPPPVPVDTPIVDADPIEQQVVGAAATYEGPLQGPNAIVGDVVHFPSGNESIKLEVGESSQGVRVVSVHPPYSVKVAWTKESTATEKYEEGIYELFVFEPMKTGPGSPFDKPPVEGLKFQASEVEIPPRRNLEEERREREAQRINRRPSRRIENDDQGQDN